MRDWHALVRAHLANLAIEPRVRSEIIEELAAHLEQSFETSLKQGLTEQEAAQGALALVESWPDLRYRIRIARTKETNMTDRVKQFWLPGFLTLFLAVGLLTLFERLGFKARNLIERDQLRAGVLFVPWLLSLPFVGAVGAFLSRRAGGSSRATLASALFSVFPWFAAMLIVFPVSLIFDGGVARGMLARAFLTGLCGWVLLPSLALLAGGLPVQLFGSRRLSSRGLPSS
jgi:hypothetical protein